jgi:hypothetical protein
MLNGVKHPALRGDNMQATLLTLDPSLLLRMTMYLSVTKSYTNPFTFKNNYLPLPSLKGGILGL